MFSSVYSRRRSQKGSFISAYSLKDGAWVWRTLREESSSWDRRNGYHENQRIYAIKQGSATGDISLRDATSAKEFVSASPIAADGKIYVSSEDGDIFVVKAGPKYELLRVNSMDEASMATPAISDGMIIVRGQKNLFGIVEISANNSKAGRDRSPYLGLQVSM